MKAFHECAVVINYQTNEPEFYFAKHGAVERNMDWQLFNQTEFESMVKEGKVQHLIWDGDHVSAKYDAEETEELYEELKKVTFKQKEIEDTIADTEKHYFDYDVRFNAAHFDRAFSYSGEPALAGCFARATKFFGINNVLLYFAGNQKGIEKFFSALKEHKDEIRADISKNFYLAGKNACYGSVPEIMLKKMLSSISNDINLMFDTSTARNSMDNMPIKTLFVKDAEHETVERVAGMLEDWTKETEKNLQQEEEMER